MSNVIGEHVKFCKDELKILKEIVKTNSLLNEGSNEWLIAWYEIGNKNKDWN